MPDVDTKESAVFVGTSPEETAAPVFTERRKAPAQDRAPHEERRVRRRANQEQGRALETLGHAIEYLMDSRLYAAEATDPRSDAEAVNLLMGLSRAVFAECAEVTTLWAKVERLCRRSFARQGRRR
jgi:hypothetical protein